MNNPKTEDVVEALRRCSLWKRGDCQSCPMKDVKRDEQNGVVFCAGNLMLFAADLIEQLQQELIDERYRHDRLQDFCVAQGEELSACISDMTAYVQRKIRDECDLCKRAAPREFCREVDYRCALCNHTAGCVCARCRAGDQFEWRGVPVPEPPKE